ncbi:MAG: DNA repair protein RecO [Firmicutes bacterium]|nr:DNA repair protein RecO [Bacillota bacterium]
MSEETCNALVLYAADYRDNDKILTLLTDSSGKLTVSAYGVRSMKNKNHAACRPMTYGEFMLKKRGDRLFVSETAPKGSFFDSFGSIEAYAAAAYVTELAGAVACENEPCPGLLSLTLNAMHALGKGEKPVALIKAAFELRVMSESGFRPDLSGCSVCKKNDGLFFDAVNGCLFCGDCGSGMLLSAPVVQAMRYITECNPKRLYAFSLEEDELSGLAAVCEKFAVLRAEKELRALSFYHNMISDSKNNPENPDRT